MGQAREAKGILNGTVTVKDNFRTAEQYILARALDARSIERGHLDYLVKNLRITKEELASLLKIPRWLLHRIIIRLQAKKFQPRVTSRGQSKSLRNRFRAHQHFVRGVHQEAYEKAFRFVAGLDFSSRSTLTADEIRYLYEELGLPQRDIGSLLGISEATVRTWLKAASITSRTVVETKTAHYNATFFKAWSPAMAWALGLLYTDGNVSRGSITLSSTDTELLEKVRELVAPRHLIRVNRQTGSSRTISMFAISHAEMCADLRRLGLAERKSGICQ